MADAETPINNLLIYQIELIGQLMHQINHPLSKTNQAKCILKPK